jgi:hypothetical protein
VEAWRSAMKFSTVAMSAQQAGWFLVYGFAQTFGLPKPESAAYNA